MKTTSFDDFHFGPIYRLRMRDDGSLRWETWRDRWRSALSDYFWPRRTFTVTSVDSERGTITLK